MNHKSIESLKASRLNVCNAIDSLTESLRPFYESSPAIFAKPLDELGATAKLIISQEIIKLAELHMTQQDTR